MKKYRQPFYGAYLIYDKESNNLVYEKDFPDHNAARERVAMGVTVALTLQQSKSSTLIRSLKLYRNFLERDITALQTAAYAYTLLPKKYLK